MLTQPFLSRLILEAQQLWALEPIALYCRTSDRAARARVAIFHIAYSAGCEPRHLCTRFGWPQIRKGYHVPTIERRHEEWLADEEYRQHFTSLEAYARQLCEGAVAQGHWRADS